MRPPRFIRAAALGLALSQGLPAFAQVPPPAPPAAAKPADPSGVLYTATVKDPQADVRSGPSDDPKMYATNRLRQGDVVEVVREREDGWLEIRPPQDSFSWINTRFLEKLTDTTWMVRAHDDTPVEVMMGSRVTDENQRPTTIGAKLKRGAIVASFWNSKVADDGVWLPITTPPSEVRYLRAAAVTKVGAAPAPAPAPAGPGTPAPAVAWNGNGTGGPAGPPVATPPPASISTPPPASIPAPPLAPVADPRWAQAEQLEKAGKIPEAEQVYRQLGNEVCNKNHDLAMRCYNRAEFLRRGTQASPVPSNPPTRPVATNSVSAYDVRLQPVPNAAPRAPSPAPASMATSVASYFGGSAPQGMAAQPSGFGRLRRSGCRVENKRTYVWEATDGRNVHLYVTEGPGVNLEPYVDRIVEVVGQIIYVGELRANYMIATQVTLQP